MIWYPSVAFFPRVCPSWEDFCTFLVAGLRHSLLWENFSFTICLEITAQNGFSLLWSSVIFWGRTRVPALDTGYVGCAVLSSLVLSQ